MKTKPFTPYFDRSLIDDLVIPMYNSIKVYKADVEKADREYYSISSYYNSRPLAKKHMLKDLARITLMHIDDQKVYLFFDNRDHCLIYKSMDDCLKYASYIKQEWLVSQ